MKVSTKAISSPGRTDKFPPPLMRFLRSNAGSRSRRSRSSPMFVRKKNNATIETQEPSSPKVTCMGQVRVRRSSKQAPTKPDTTPSSRCRCWIPEPNNLCRWPNWSFFNKKPTKLKTDQQDRANVHNAHSFASSNSIPSRTPPRNALLLTRCRSAPYSSSSLAGKFWGSGEEVANESSISDQSDSETEPRLGFFKVSLREKIASIAKSELSKGSEAERDSDLRPVVLTRCKSEPARTGHRLDPQLALANLKYSCIAGCSDQLSNWVESAKWEAHLEVSL
ncbi:hypothetical protein RJT34_19842 [Clitoria ternatea]|uniref:Uncharacterized protein n=1 Tax=Clitoria ternatea TaxID=43366 RepID=A0AAN9IS83_CLITE